MTTDRTCEYCERSIAEKRSDARFCSKRCQRAPRSLGSFCEECGEAFCVSLEYKDKARFCSKRCAQINIYKRKNPDIDENFFEKPNLQNSYWAGFIAADGCIHQPKIGRRQLTVRLKSTDRNHLVSLQSVIGGGRIVDCSTYDKRTNRTYHSSAYTIPSDKICHDLASRFNIHQRKSLSHQPPNLSGDLAYAFIAGYIDGDGHYGQKSNRPRMGVAGTFEFLSWIVTTVGLEKIPRKVGKIYIVEFYGKKAIAVQSLYINLDLPLLDRKRKAIEAWS